MPKGDGTGPRGMGLMTGWGTGNCAGFYGRGAGLGLRQRNGGYAAGMQGRRQMCNVPVVDTRDLLLRQAGILENQLDAIKKRLAELA